MAEAYNRLKRLLGQDRSSRDAYDRIKELLGEEDQGAAGDAPANAKSKAAYNELIETGSTTYRGKEYRAARKPEQTPYQKAVNDASTGEAMALVKGMETALQERKAAEPEPEARSAGKAAAQSYLENAREGETNPALAGALAAGLRQSVDTRQGTSTKELFVNADLMTQNAKAAAAERDRLGMELASNPGLMYNADFTQKLSAAGSRAEATTQAADRLMREYNALAATRREAEEKEQYGGLYKNQDYYTKSKGSAETAARADSTVSPSLSRYKTIYNRKEEQTRRNAGGDPVSSDAASFITDREAGNYFYLWETQGAKAADAYYNQYLKDDLQKRKSSEILRYAQAYAQKSPVLASAASVGTNLAGIAGIIDLAVQNATRRFGDASRPINYDSMWQIPSRATETIRGTVGGQISKSVTEQLTGKVSDKAAEGWGNFAAFLYQTGMSMADSGVQALMVKLGIPEAATLTLMGGSAGTAAIREAKERGATDGQALMTGIAAAFAEGMFERVSLDNLLEGKNIDSLRRAVTETLKQGFIEGSEEVNTSLMNTVADMIINGDRSEISANANRYMASGLGEGEARKAAAFDWLKSIGMDALGGFLSGGVMGGASAGIQGGYQAYQTGQVNRALGQMENAVREQAFRDALAEIEENGAEEAEVAEEGQEAAAPPLPQQEGQERGNTPPMPQNAQRGAEEAGDSLISPSGTASHRGSQETGEESQTLGNPPVPGLGADETGGNNSGEARLRIAPLPERENPGSGLRIGNRQQQEKAQQRQRQMESQTAESLRNRGFENAGEDATVYVRSEDQWDAEERAIAERLRLGGTEPTFVTGLLQNAEGQKVSFLRYGDQLALQTDNRRESLSSIVNRATGITITETEGNRIGQAENPAAAVGQQADRGEAAPAAAEARDQLFDGGRGRILENGAGEQAGSQRNEALRQIDRAGRRRSQKEDIERVSVGSLGIRGAGENSEARVLRESGWDEELRTTAQAVERATGCKVSYVLDGIRMPNGVRARGVYTGDRIIIQADHNSVSVKKLAAHEAYHAFANADAGLNDRIRERIIEQGKGGKLDETLRTYVAKLAATVGLSEDMDQQSYEAAINRLLEEIFADAYAGLNAYGAEAGQFMEEARETVGAAGSAENAAATERRTGPPERYSFAGQKAREADSRSLAEAERMEQSGEDPENIRQETGWFRGDDGMWRFEIDDSGMQYSRRGDAEYLNNPEYREYQDLWDKVVVQMNASAEELERMRELDKKYKGVVPLMQYKLANGGAKLGDIINHDALFRNYPQLKNTGVEFAELKEGTYGQYNKARNVIELSYALQDAPEDTLIHEIQHVIQNIEGFASGASPEYWANNPVIRTEAKEKVQAAKDRVAQVEEKFRKEWPNDEINLNLARQYDDLTEQYFSDDNADLLGTMQKLNEIENAAKEAGFADLLDEYLEARGLLSLAEEEAKRKIVDPNRLYIRTAGEIEARDAASRRNMTQEQRLKIRPNVGSEDIVFADGENAIREGAGNQDIRYSAEEEIPQSAAAQAAEQEAQTLGSREILDTPALKKLGVKVSGSVGDYGKTESLIAKDRAAKSIRKEAVRAERRLKATDAEKDFANGITAGIYREEDIPARLNKDTVMELADYYWAVNSANLQTLHQLRADINAGLRDDAEGFLAEADIKPISMIELNERTPERAFRKMFGEKAQGITKWLLDPVRENEAEKIRWYNQQMDAVRKFTDSKGKSRELTRAESALTMRLMEGRAAADMVAGMETKAAIENAAANIRKGGDAADAAREFSLSGEERDLAEKYAGWLDTQEELKTADSTIVEAAAKKYAELFDDYYDAINDFLVAHGYEPIGYIKGYAPHMQPEENQSLLKKAFKSLGINEEVTALPASIAGQTTFFKPNKRWNPYFLQRTGSEANYDIVKAYQSYVDYMADILYHTDDVMRVRQTANWIRKTYAPEEIREKLDWAQELRNAPTEDKQRLLRDAGKIGQSTILSAVDTTKAMQEYIDGLYEQIGNSTKNSNLVMWLDNYANILAGKQSFADRGWEYSTGRKSLNIANKLNNAFQKANVAGNLSSILNQTAQLPMIYAELGERDFLKAVADLANRNTKVWAQDSDFLTAKEGKELLYTDNADKFVNLLFAPAGFMDHLVSTVAVRGAFNKAIRQGASYAEAMQKADAFGQAVMGSRAKGSRPLAYESKGFFSKMVHMFQIEAVNSWDHLASDLPNEIRKIAKTQGKPKAAAALAGLILRALIGAFALNRLTDEIYGGTPAPFDVLGLTANFVASGKGLSTNAYIRTIIDNTMDKMGYERLFGTESMTKEDFDLEAAADELLYNVMNDVPLVRNAAGVLGLGDQTVALPGAGGEFKNLGTAVKNMLKEGVEPGEIGNLLKAMGLAATQFIPGGRQISKTAQGAETIIRGGSYNGYKKPKLQYPLEDGGDFVKALLFGKNATNAAKEYWAAGGNALTEKQTALYTSLASHGVGRKDAYDAIQRYREIAKDDSMTSFERGKAERALLAGLDISDEDKLDMYRELNNAESKAEKFRAIMDTGLSFGQVMDIQDKYAEIDNMVGVKAGEKAKEFSLWVDNQTYTKKQKTAIKDQLKYFQSIPAEAARYEKLTASGLSPDMSARIDQAIGKLTPEAGKTDVSDTQKWRAAINTVSGEANQKKALQALMTEDQYAKFEAASEAGISPGVYVKYKEETKGLTSDKDADGKTINGSLKQKVVNYIDGLNLTPDQKSALLKDYNKDYKNDVSWHNGSGGGKGSGSYAKARTPALRIPAAPTVSKTSSGLRIRGTESEPARQSSGLRIRAAAPAAQPTRSGLRIKAQ